MCGSHLSHITHDHDNGHRHAQTPPRAVIPTLTRPCPQCGQPLQEDFVFCPNCGAEALTACPSCHRAVQADWTHCAYCGADLRAGKTDSSIHSPHQHKE